MDISAKLKRLTDEIGSPVSLAYDRDLDRWVVTRQGERFREVCGTGRCAEDAVDAACRRLGVEIVEKKRGVYEVRFDLLPGYDTMGRHRMPS